MMKTKVLPIALAAIACLLLSSTNQAIFAQGNPFLSSQPGYPNWSPFTDIKWDNDRPVVEVKGQWYELVSIHGVPTDEILKACQKHGWDTRRRVAEDLVQILRLMGHEVEKTTDLVLRRKDGQRITMNNVVMSEENLRSLNRRHNPVVPADLARINPFFSGQPGYPNWSPFTGIKWDNDRPSVEVDGKWYELVKLHGVTVDEIREACEKNGWPYRHRFTEDHVQIIRLMGHDIDRTTDLELRDASGKAVALNNVKMTEANLKSLMRPAPLLLSRQDLLEDLEFFQTTLEEQFAYLKANGADYESAIDAIAESTQQNTDRNRLAGELQKVMSLFIDGHASVEAADADFASGFLPIRIVPSGNRFVAVAADRSRLVNDRHPYIRALDGIPLSDWLDATEKFLPRGSAQYRTRGGLRLLESIQQFRTELGIPTSEPVEAELVSRDGLSTWTMPLPVADRPIRPDTWPPNRVPEIAPGNIGYLRLASMGDRSVELLRTWMPKFRDTDGLIIDVRDNGGGARTPILELAGYLLSPEDPPRIANVAKYRLAEHFREDHLSRARYVYRKSSPRFGQRERAEIGRFMKDFHPQWSPPDEEFSQWHYLVLSKDADDPRYNYRKPVAILLDEGCFSATDIFLGAFKGWPRVTLIGQPSSGGSARTESFQLPHSGIGIRCASMASFQPSGQLYDTRGVQPDIRVTRPPEYYVRDLDDVILHRAMEVIKQKAGQ